METLWLVVLMAPPLLVAVILHEIAHGYVAERLGDPTARAAGRITLNPIVHIDLFMTILLPALLIFAGSPVIFGGAKPVPVNPGYFKDPAKGMSVVAIAGPITNFILALISFGLYQAVLAIPSSDLFLGLGLAFVANWLVYSVLINVVLGVFNLLPVPPLDGGRIAVGLLPVRLAQGLARLEPFGILIVFLLLYLGVVEAVLGPVIEFTIGALRV